VWDPEYSEKIAVFKNNTPAVNYSSLNNTMFVSKKNKIMAKVNNLGANIHFFSRKNLKATFNYACCSPDGKLLAYPAILTLIVCDMKTGEPIYKIEEHKKDIVCLAWAPSGILLASGSEDENLIIY